MSQYNGPLMDEIKGKQVLLSQPYSVPDTGQDSASDTTWTVGRGTELEMVTAAWMAGPNCRALAPLLLGEPGVGKNHLVYELARRTGKNLYIFQGHEDVTSEDLACTVRFADGPGNRMEYVASPLVTAMHLGDICFIDEIAKIRPRALALLVSVLDERRYIDSTLLGLRVEAHEGFRFIAATNTADLEGNALPEFIRSRMRPVIPVGYLPQDQLEDIVAKRYPRLQSQVAPLLEHFWRLWWRKDDKTPPTPRDVIYVFDLALSLADFRILDKRTRPYPLKVSGAGATVEREDLDIAFQELFRRDGINPKK
jgi:MoxR-like ATPase